MTNKMQKETWLKISEIDLKKVFRERISKKKIFKQKTNATKE